MLTSWKARLIEQHQLVEDHFDINDVAIVKEYVQWKSYHFKYCVCSESSIAYLVYRFRKKLEKTVKVEIEKKCTQLSSSNLIENRTKIPALIELGFKNFDIPMMAKRMIINGLLPPSILPSYDTKPWDIKAIDTREIWQFGAYTAIGSLDLMCASMEVPSPKDGEVTGDKVHDAYWNKGMLKEISEYCERDVNVLIDIIKKLKALK